MARRVSSARCWRTVDGAGRWSTYWNVTIPMLSGTLFYVLIIGIIGSLQTFTQAFFIQHTSSI